MFYQVCLCISRLYPLLFLQPPLLIKSAIYSFALRLNVSKWSPALIRALPLCMASIYFQSGATSPPILVQSNLPFHVPLMLCVCESLSCVWLFATPWTGAHQAPLSMEFPRQEYWSGLLFPSLGDLPNPGMEPWFPTLQADALPSVLLGEPLFFSKTQCFQASWHGLPLGWPILQWLTVALSF